jgi:hypothetical protein
MIRQAVRSKLPSLRDRLPFGRDGLLVSPYCLGITRDPRVVLAAFERGVNFFFLTADMHWPLYESTRRGLEELFRSHPGARDQVVVAGVSYVADPDFMIQPFLEVIEALPGLGRLDALLVGGAKASQEPRFDAIARTRASGIVPGIRATGASFHDRALAARMLAGGGLDIALVRYNSDHRGAEHDLFPRVALDRETLLFNFKTTQGFVRHSRFDELGFEPDAWRPGVPDHYRFALGRPELDGILCSPGNLAELDALTLAIEKGPLSAEETTYLKCVSDLHRGRARPRRTEASVTAP